MIAADEPHGTLVISEKARITGKVKASHVIINIEAVGPVESDDLLELQPGALGSSETCGIRSLKCIKAPS